MGAIDRKEELRDRIAFLQNRRELEFEELKEQFHITCKSLKPINLIKDSLQEITSSSDMKKDLLMGALNLTTGYLSHKMDHNPVKNILEKALGFVMKKFSGKKTEEAIETE
jgi:hypothetical protein